VKLCQSERDELRRQAALAAFPGELERYRGQETTPEACRKRAAKAAVEAADALIEALEREP
jgi:hypothetical protein